MSTNDLDRKVIRFRFEDDSIICFARLLLIVGSGNVICVFVDDLDCDVTLLCKFDTNSILPPILDKRY